MAFIQYYIPLTLFLNSEASPVRLHWTTAGAGSAFLTAPFVGLVLTVIAASIVAYLESKRIIWVLTRIGNSLGPMFRRRLKKVVKLDKKETLIDDFNGILDRFLKKIEASKPADKKARINLTKAEAIAVLKSVIDDGTQ